MPPAGDALAAHDSNLESTAGPFGTTRGGPGSDGSECAPREGPNGNSDVPGDTTLERLAPTALVVLLATILFFYVGTAIGYGAWVAVVALRDKLGSERDAVRLAR